MKKKLSVIIIALLCAFALVTLSSCEFIFDAIFGPADNNGGDTDKKPVVVHTHKTVKKTIESSVCSGADEVTYWYCDGCGKSFADEQANEEITDLEALALGHIFVMTSDADAHWQQCKNCLETNGEKQPHTSDKWLSDKENHYKVCTVCKTKFSCQPHDVTDNVCGICNFNLDYTVRCNSDYGREFFAALSNGEKFLKFYDDIDAVATAFHDDAGADATLTRVQGENFYTLGDLSFSKYGFTKEEALSVWSVYRHDHPLYYWIDGTAISDSESIKLSVPAEYSAGAKRAEQNTRLYALIDAYLDTVADKSDDYGIALSFHDSIIDNVNYAYKEDGKTPETADWAHNIVGVLQNGSAVCEGYAKTFQLLLNACNVNNVFVTGRSNDSGHAWNLVELEGKWYWYDLTWDDQPSFPRGVIYDYFCKTDAEFKDHEINSDNWGTNYLYRLPAAATENYNTEELEMGEQFQYGGFTFELCGSEALSLVSCSLSGQVAVPETVVTNGISYKVVEIGKNAFTSNKVTSLTIPSSVKVIYNFAFKGCSKLTSVTFEDTQGWTRNTMNNTVTEEVELTDPSSSATLLKEFYQYRQGIAIIVEHQYIWVKGSK